MVRGEARRVNALVPSVIYGLRLLLPWRLKVCLKKVDTRVVDSCSICSFVKLTKQTVTIII